MCGIAGIMAHRRGVPVDMAVRRMLPALARRGPDSEGVWVDEHQLIAFGHRRLAVIDPSPAGAQPMVSASGQTVVAFNGCIYNYRELRSELEIRGVRLRTQCDTEVLVEAIERWGVDKTIRRLDGMFAFSVWEQRSQRLTLARDRFGEKPLYIADTDDGLVWASDVAALRQARAFDSRISRSAVNSLIRWGFIPHPLSIYEGARQLPPGSMLVVESGSQREQSWWSAWNLRRQPTEVDTHELDRLLEKTVADRLVADVPLGAFLSGGIDSSLIAAYGQRALGDTKLRTFTVSMPDLGYDESDDAAGVASAIGTEHTTLFLTESDALSLVPQLPTMWTEPFADPSMLPTALLCREVRKSVTVALSGDGGDEIFAGYNRHVHGPRNIARFSKVPRPARWAMAKGMSGISPETWDKVLGRFTDVPNPGDKVHKLANLAEHGTNGAFHGLVGMWPDGEITLSSPAYDPLYARRLPDDPLDALLVADTASVLPDNMLVKTDRASMSYGLELRAPFLAPALVDLAWRMPQGRLVEGGVGKVALREVLHRMVPKQLVDRPKLGFDPPVDRWLRGPLRPWAEHLLYPQRLVDDGFLNAELVRSTWDDHLAGRRNNGHRLWAVLMLNAWIDSVR